MCVIKAKYILDDNAKKLFHPNHSTAAWTSTNHHGIGTQGQNHGVNTQDNPSFDAIRGLPRVSI